MFFSGMLLSLAVMRSVGEFLFLNSPPPVCVWDFLSPDCSTLGTLPNVNSLHRLDLRLTVAAAVNELLTSSCRVEIDLYI